MPGISYECASNGHHGCREGGCRCRCHYMAKDLIDRVSTPVERTATPAHEETAQRGLVCPKCGTAAGANDRYCRKDGTRLKPPTVHCGGCGAEAPEGDLYCAACGRPLSEEVTVKSGGVA